MSPIYKSAPGLRMQQELIEIKWACADMMPQCGTKRRSMMWNLPACKAAQRSCGTIRLSHAAFHVSDDGRARVQVRPGLRRSTLAMRVMLATATGPFVRAQSRALQACFERQLVATHAIRRNLLRPGFRAHPLSSKPTWCTAAPRAALNAALHRWSVACDIRVVRIADICSA